MLPFWCKLAISKYHFILHSLKITTIGIVIAPKCHVLKIYTTKNIWYKSVSSKYIGPLSRTFKPQGRKNEPMKSLSDWSMLAEATLGARNKPRSWGFMSGIAFSKGPVEGRGEQGVITDRGQVSRVRSTLNRSAVFFGSVLHAKYTCVCQSRVLVIGNGKIGTTVTPLVDLHPRGVNQATAMHLYCLVLSTAHNCLKSTT